MAPLRSSCSPVLMRTLGIPGVLLGLAIARPAYGNCTAIAPLPERQNFPALLPGDRGTDVRTVQTLLTLMGDYRGAIDGIFNEDLTRAVQAFQSRAGLPPTGQLTIDTWAKLLPHQTSGETCREAT